MKKTKRGIEVASEWTPRSDEISRPKWVPYETGFNEDYSYDSLEDLRLNDFQSSSRYKNRCHNDNKNNNSPNDDFEASRRRSRSSETADKNYDDISDDYETEASDLSCNEDLFNSSLGGVNRLTCLSADDPKHQNSGHNIPFFKNDHNENHHHNDDYKEKSNRGFHEIKINRSSRLTDKNYSSDEKSLEFSENENSLQFNDENFSINDIKYTSGNGDGISIEPSVKLPQNQKPNAASLIDKADTSLKQKILEETLNTCSSFKNLLLLLFSADAVLLAFFGFKKTMCTFKVATILAIVFLMYLIICEDLCP